MGVSSSNLAGRVAVCGACAMGLLLLASLFVPDDSRAGGRAAPARSLGSLETVDYRVELEAGPFGPLYTIRQADGSVIATSITRGEVESRFPDVDLTGVASGEGQALMWVDPADH